MDNDRSNSIRVVHRAFDLLEAFEEREPRLPLHRIAQRIGLPKTTTFRLLSTLIETGYVMQTPAQDYCLSPKVMRLASVAQRGFDIRDVARPVMLELADSTGETLDLSILKGLQRVCLDVVESHHRLKSIIEPGDVLPLHHGATGKAMMAHAAPDTVMAMLSAASEVDAIAFQEGLRQVRAKGYAVSQGERVRGATALAVALSGQGGRSLYTLTITGPSFRFEGRIEDFARQLIDGGRRISDQLGGSAVESGGRIAPSNKKRPEEAPWPH